MCVWWIIVTSFIYCFVLDVGSQALRLTGSIGMRVYTYICAEEFFIQEKKERRKKKKKGMPEWIGSGTGE